jgi:TadE-like protein
MKKTILSTHKGQSLVEFALLIPAFLLMTVMIFDLGRAVYYSSTIHNAAREGARYGIVNPDDVTGMKQTAINYAVGLGLSDTDIAINIVIPANKSSFPPPHITVIITYDFYPATPLVSRFITGGHLTLTGEATMKLEILP